MSEFVIKSELLKDNTSTTAAAVYAAYPEFYGSVSDVPRHVYTCLADMVSATFNLPLASAVNISNDDGSGATVGIVIDPVVSYETDYCDNIGAQKAKVSILVKGVRTGVDPTLPRDIGLRIWYILDNNNRAIEGNTFMANQTYQDIDTSADNTILNPTKVSGCCYKLIHVRSDKLGVGQWGHVYDLEFFRNFGGF